MDLIVPPLARLTGVETAARLFLLAAQVLVLTGAAALEWAVKRRVHLSGFLALLALNSLPFAWGFVNFEFGLGLALWGMAFWIGLPAGAWKTRALLHVAVTAACFVAHLFSLGLYGYVLGLHELWRLWTRRTTLPASLGRFALLAAPAAALAAAMAVSGGAVGQAGTAWNWSGKPLGVILLMDGYGRALAAASLIGLCVLVLLLTRRGMLRLEAPGAAILAGLGVLYVGMPAVLQDTAFVDIRVLAGALLVVPAFAAMSAPPRIARLALAAMTGLALANVAWAASLWLSYRADYDDLIASFGRIDRGAHVLIGHTGAGQDPPIDDLTEYPIYNAPTLAVHYADAFVPTLFTAPGKQPIAVQEGSARLAVPYGGPVAMADLRALAEGRSAPEAPDYARAWTRDFACLYAVGPQDGNPMPERLEPLAVSRRFSLYRIRAPR